MEKLFSNWRESTFIGNSDDESDDNEEIKPVKKVLAFDYDEESVVASDNNLEVPDSDESFIDKKSRPIDKIQEVVPDSDEEISSDEVATKSFQSESGLRKLHRRSKKYSVSSNNNSNPKFSDNDESSIEITKSAKRKNRNRLISSDEEDNSIQNGIFSISAVLSDEENNIGTPVTNEKSNTICSSNNITHQTTSTFNISDSEESPKKDQRNVLKTSKTDRFPTIDLTHLPITSSEQRRSNNLNLSNNAKSIFREQKAIITLSSDSEEDKVLHSNQALAQEGKLTAQLNNVNISNLNNENIQEIYRKSPLTKASQKSSGNDYASRLESLKAEQTRLDVQVKDVLKDIDTVKLEQLPFSSFSMMKMKKPRGSGIMSSMSPVSREAKKVTFSPSEPGCQYPREDDEDVDSEVQSEHENRLSFSTSSKETDESRPEQEYTKRSKSSLKRDWSASESSIGEVNEIDDLLEEALDIRSDESSPPKRSLYSQNMRDESRSFGEFSSSGKEHCVSSNQPLLHTVSFYRKQQNMVPYVKSLDDEINVHMLNALTDLPYEYYTNYYLHHNPEEPQLTSLNESQSFRNEASAQKATSSRIGRLMYLKQLLVKKDKLLIDLEKQLLELLSKNKERQNTIQDALTQADKSKTKECGSSRCCFRKFGMPYFKDNKLFGAPPNKDHLHKIKRKELTIESIPTKSSWTKLHKKMMKNAIKDSLINEKSLKLTKEINKIKDMLEGTANENNTNIKLLKKQIVEKQNELRGLSKKSYNELVLCESEDREYDWMKFSATLFDGLHSSEECRRFWNQYLKPSINKEAWSEVENSKLLEIAAQKNYQDWDEIAKILGTNRSAYQCFVHFKSRLEDVSNISNGKWTDIEDKQLLTLIYSSKIGNYIPWNKVYSHFGNRNHNQIYSRWAHSLNPDLVKGKFSKEEDIFIVASVEVFNLNFKEIASLMSNRTSSQVRKRYRQHLLRKTTKVGIWSLEEDEKLLTLIGKYGAQNWSKISHEMKTRTSAQVRQRYSSIKKMRKKKPGWTVTQVKRRNIQFGKKSKRINKAVEKVKKDIDGIKKDSRLSDIEKETILNKKLTELRDKIFSRNSGKRGRKRKEVSVGSEVNDFILDLFSTSYTKSIIKPSKSIIDIDIESTKFFLVQDTLALTLESPKSVEEIQDNPKLNITSKCILKHVLNSNRIEYSSKNLFERQICSGMAVSTRENSSRHRIDYQISMEDDTIIMMDSWHTPDVNVASLNFSEIFKQTVFDYSNGMHQDIWNSKLRRSKMSNTSHRDSCNDQDIIDQGTNLKSQSYNLPPNHSTVLGLRSILLNRAILGRLCEDEKFMHPISCDFVKKKVKDKKESDNDFKRDPVFLNACKQFESTLESLFTWPRVLLATKVGSVPVHNGQNLQMRHQLELLRNLSYKSQTNFCSNDVNLKNEKQ